MRILLSVEHPAWAHQFRYVIRELEKRGHEVKVVAIKKDVDLELLDAFGIKYEVISNSSGKSLFDKGLIFLKTIWRIFLVSRRFKPDLFIGRASPMMAINAFLFRKKHIVFEDTEISGFCLKIARLLSSVLLTPTWFKKDLGKKQVRINTYKELFYLHPAYFTPDPAILTLLRVKPEDKIAVVRLVAWDAHHDIGKHGLSTDSTRRLISELKKHARVFISSEAPLAAEFEQYRLIIPPERLHDVLNYASLCVSEGSTTAVEAGIMGTPCVFISPVAKDCGNFDSMHHTYGLMLAYTDEEEALKKAIELAASTEAKSEWKQRRERMLADKVDIVMFMTRFIEEYANSNSAQDKNASIAAGVLALHNTKNKTSPEMKTGERA